MIGRLRGEILVKQAPHLLLEVNGVGYELEAPMSTFYDLPEVGKQVVLFTHLAVREDALTLFGFYSMEERELFEMLLQVSGIGPSLALAVLSNLSIEVIRNAVSANQPEVLARVPGIGKKTAEKVAFHLKDKIGIAVDVVGQPTEVDAEVLSVLTTLGYSITEAHAAIRSIPRQAPEDVEERLRYALQYFAT